jgi:hypothetical protein
MRIAMRILLGSLALALTTLVATAHAKPEPKYMDGKVTYKFAGVDGNFDKPEDACKAGVDDLTKHGNKKTFDSVKEGSSSTSMTCVVKESDGKTITELGNTISKILECPDTTSARSTDNSGEFSKMKCKCDDKKGCPKPAPAKK